MNREVMADSVTSKRTQALRFSMLSLACLCAYASNLAAQEHRISAYPPAAYIGTELGALYYDNACEPTALACDDKDRAASVFGGYRFNRYLTLELAYRDLGEAHATYPRLTTTLDVAGQMRGYGMDVLVSVPFSDAWSGYVRGGAFYAEAETESVEFQTEDRGWAPAAGAGIAWQFRPSWQARIQYLFVSGVGGSQTGESNAETLSLGLSYFFGQHATPPATPVAIPSAPSQSPPPPAAPEMPPCPAPLPAWDSLIYFGFDSDDPIAAESLDPLTQRMQANPQTTVRIAGYADSSGSSAYNLTLSQRRAQAVADLFRARGIDARRIDVSGFGESEVDAGTGSVRDALSRRVRVTSAAVSFEDDQCQRESP